MKFSLNLPKSDLAKNTSLYVVVSIISAGFSFLTLTVFSNKVTDVDVGKVETFLTFGTLLQTLMLWGNEALLINYYSKYGNKKEFETAFLGIISQTLILSVLLYFVPVLFEEYDRWIIYSSLLFAVLNSLLSLITTCLQLEAKVKRYSIITLCLSGWTFIVCIILLKFDASCVARILSSILVIFFLCIFCFPRFYRQKISNVKFCIKDIICFYKKGGVLVASQISSWGIERIDRFQIISMLGIANLGVYSIAAQFSLGAMVLEAAVSRAWQPYVIKNADRDRRKMIGQIIRISCCLFVVITILSVLILFYIKWFLPKEYETASYLSAILCFGYCFDGMWKLYNNIIVYENKFKLSASVVVLCAILKLALNILLIPFLGLLGAAITSLLVFAAGFFMNMFYVHFKMKWFSQTESIPNKLS